MKKEMKAMTALMPCPAVLLSVRGKKKPNIITLSWAANVCSDPPSVAVGIRKVRYSHELVKEAGEFVLNIPGSDLLESVQFCGAKSGRDHDKFSECGLTPIPATKVDAPMIEECIISLECRTTKIVEVGVHDLFIAEVIAVHIDDSVLDAKGRFEPARANLFAYLPLNAQYWNIGEQL